MKPLPIGGANVIGAPALGFADDGDLVGEVEFRQRIGRRQPRLEPIPAGAAFDVPPHVGHLDGLAGERDVILVDHDRPHGERPPAERDVSPGNPGRPRGAKHKITRACEALLEKDAAAITAKAIELAKTGDLTALRLCLDRIVPPRRERAIVFDLPRVNALADLPRALSCILEAVSRGEILPSEGASLASLLAATRSGFEAVEVEARLAELERRWQEEGLHNGK